MRSTPAASALCLLFVLVAALAPSLPDSSRELAPAPEPRTLAYHVVLEHARQPALAAADFAKEALAHESRSGRFTSTWQFTPRAMREVRAPELGWLPPVTLEPTTVLHLDDAGGLPAGFLANHALAPPA